MKILKDGLGTIRAIELERLDTLEEMAAISALPMDSLSQLIEDIIMKSREGN